MPILDRVIRSACAYGAILVGLVCASGCASWPSSEIPGSQIGQEELSTHVRFLADPGLAGRRPRSTGSAVARRYIEQQFAACGLAPWGRAKGFSQSFVLGTNVVGVLRGSDPNLAQDVVILCAHYDHLGWTPQGLCRGAADNASGVAAMLEIAEDLALTHPRPRRSVCFVASDLEETFFLGAFAFTCRQDYDPNRIAGVVNLDLLGRDGFEVLDHCLFLVGTESYPGLRRQIQGLASGRIEVLPIGTDMAGPRGDHVVFEPLGVPSLFFTCSLYKDYHGPGDTADKVDYDDLLRSAQVARDTVRLLADGPGRCVPIPASHGDIEELETLHLCLRRVAEAPERLNLTRAERQSVQGLVEKTGQLLQENDYSLDDRRQFLWWHAAETLIPLVERFEAPRPARRSKPPSERSLALDRRARAVLSIEARAAMVKAGQAFIRHVSRSRHPFLAGMAPFTYAQSWLPDRYLSLTPLDPQHYKLTAARPYLGFRLTWPPVWLWPVRRLNLAGSGAGMGWFSAEGTREELTDVCLLAWGSDKDPNVRLGFWQATLNRVTGESSTRSYEQWLDWRLAQGRWPDERSWLTDRARTHNRCVACELLRRVWQHGSRADAESVTCSIMSDPNQGGEIRNAAIQSVKGKVSGRMLLALASVIDDPNPIPPGVVITWDDPFLSELQRYLFARDKKTEEPVKPKARPRPRRVPTTLGELAQWKLRGLTGKDFGKDREAWIRWIERYRR